MWCVTLGGRRLGRGPGSRRAIRTLAVLVALPAVLSSCVLGGDDSPDGGDGAAATTSSAAPSLDLVDGFGEVFCDGTDQPLGEITGAEPGEAIELSSPEPISLAPEQIGATADDDGSYRLTWRCDPGEAGTPWELHVRGGTSGGQLTVTFVGTSTDPALADVLQVALAADAVICDGHPNDLGQLSNARPWEEVTFTGSPASATPDGTADGDGNLALTWVCEPAEATTWQVSATGSTSERIGAFTVVGVAPPPEVIPTPTVQISEDPFVCDGGSRVFAIVTDFVPNEYVYFSSPHSTALGDGQADDTGTIPLQWTCGSADAGTVWEVTATGSRSRRSVTFAVTGAAPPPLPDPVVTVAENPFRCDGATRFFATISGYLPNEYVDFTSPQVESLRQGQADDGGTLQLRWTCEPADAGRVWDLTATGATSALSASLQITGTAES